MSDLPSPLTPPECDLRGMPFMPVDLVRLFDSDLYALSTGDEFKAAFTLWGKAFLQVPAGSLPTDDRILAHLSGAGGTWRKVRDMALRGWIKCSDGRLHHPVVAEKAKEAWEARVAQRARTEAARQARAQRRQSSDTGATDNVTTSVTSSVTEVVTGSKGQGQGQGQGIEERTPLTPAADAAGGPSASKPRNSRAHGTNPRAVAEAARAAAPPAPEPDHPLWPRCRAWGMSGAAFANWVAPLIEVDCLGGKKVLIAPTRFHSDYVTREFAQPLDGYEIRVKPEAAAHG